MSKKYYLCQALQKSILFAVTLETVFCLTRSLLCIVQGRFYNIVIRSQDALAFVHPYQ
jgi:hypothetical protein